jgi:pilus assembly protein CpaC
MITFTRAFGLARTGAMAVAIAALLAASPNPARAQAEEAADTLVRITERASSVPRRIMLGIGKSVVIELPRDAKEVFVANPKVANAVVRSARKVFLIGMGDGATSVFVMDADGQQIANLEIAIGRDLNILRRTLRTALPKAQIEVVPVGDTIVLTGTVDSAVDAQQAVDITKGFVGVSAVGGAAVAGSVINSLTLRGKDQVMLKVTVAEVNRNIIKQFGVNLSGQNWSIANTSLRFTDLANSAISSGGIEPGTIGANIVRGITDPSNTQATLKALERHGLLRLLAEPTLAAISGETAKFLAGGEVPLPSSETCEPGTVRCTIGISYRPVGVSLTFTPVVLAEGRISLRVGTEVSEVDAESGIRLTAINVPGIKTRRMETTVELPSGGSIVTAGLIQRATRQQLDKVPALGNLPVLGLLFRSRAYQRQETELMIMVTPYIAKPVSPAAIARPDDGFVEPSDAQAILLGRFNRIYGVAGAPAPTAAYRGKVGFIVKD